MKRYLLSLLILCSCQEKPSTELAYLRKNHLLESEASRNSKFYKGFDLFCRKGIEELTGDTLYFPFLMVKAPGDSIIEVTLYSGVDKTSYRIPKDNRVSYRFNNISDGPRHVFTKILDDKIISYGYDNTLKELKEVGIDSLYFQDIIPSEIKVISCDSINTYYFGECLDFKGIDIDRFRVPVKDVEKYWIQPFTAKLKSGCRYKTFSTEKENIQNAEGFRYWFQHYGEERSSRTRE